MPKHKTFTLRLPEPLHRAVVREASREMLSVAALIRRAVGTEMQRRAGGERPQ